MISDQKKFWNYIQKGSLGKYLTMSDEEVEEWLDNFRERQRKMTEERKKNGPKAVE